MRLLFLASALVYYLPHILDLMPDLIWPASLVFWIWTEGHPDEAEALYDRLGL